MLEGMQAVRKERKLLEIILTQAQTLLLAVGVFFIGSFLHAQSFYLQKFNIPEPVIGGLIVAALLFVWQLADGMNVVVDAEIRDDLMLIFFATVGLNAKFSLIAKGGKRLVIFFFVTVAYLFVQNIIGVGMAKVLGLDPFLGLIAGSITLTGGHGTGASYANQFPQIEGGVEIAMACATLGLVLGGIIGGPISEWLIEKNGLAPESKVKNPMDALKDHGFDEPEVVTTNSILTTVTWCLAAIFLGRHTSDYLHSHHYVMIPTFVFVMFFGIIITNILEFFENMRPQQQSIDLVSMTSLSLFLSIAMASIKLWQLVDLALPMMAIIAVQTLVTGLFAFHITFRALGSNYEAAALAGGHCGFGLGATPTAVANIESVCNRYGPAPTAMFLTLIIGAFCIDLANTVVIQIFLGLFVR